MEGVVGGGVAGRGLGYNLASGTKRHCLFQESADCTEPGALLHIRTGTQTRAYTSSRAWTETGCKRAIASHQEGDRKAS